MYVLNEQLRCKITNPLICNIINQYMHPNVIVVSRLTAGDIRSKVIWSHFVKIYNRCIKLLKHRSHVNCSCFENALNNTNYYFRMESCNTSASTAKNSLVILLRPKNYLFYNLKLKTN